MRNYKASDRFFDISAFMIGLVAYQATELLLGSTPPSLGKVAATATLAFAAFVLAICCKVREGEPTATEDMHEQYFRKSRE